MALEEPYHEVINCHFMAYGHVPSSVDWGSTNRILDIVRAEAS